MQLNLNLQEDFTKPPYAREGEDKFCNITKDQLLTWLEESDYGQNLDKWREHFCLDHHGNSSCYCNKCQRPLSHHHTDHSREYKQDDRFLPEAPIPCMQVQSRLIRSKQQGLSAQLMFFTNPKTGEELCRACRYRVDQHSNGEDIADAMTNAMGFGGLMQGMSGGQMGGDHRRRDLTPEEERWQQEIKERKQLLHPERAQGRCPYTQEDLLRFEWDSCYQRYKSLYSLYFTSGTKKPNENIAPTVCTICRQERKWHQRDGTIGEDTEEESWQPKCKEPCPQVQQYFENQRDGMLGSVLILFSPYSNQEVCGQCKWPLKDHDDGPDQSAEMQKQIQGMVGGILGGQGGKGGAGGGGMNNPFAMMAGLQKFQQAGGVQVNTNLQTKTNEGVETRSSTTGGPQHQQNQNNNNNMAGNPFAMLGALQGGGGGGGQQRQQQQQPQNQQHNQQQQQQQPTSNYQQFGSSSNSDSDGYVEVMQMEMCCGCIPRMVKKKVKVGHQQQQQQQAGGFPFGGAMM